MLFDEDLANGLDPSCSTRLDGGSELDLPAMVRMVMGISRLPSIACKASRRFPNLARILR